MTYKESCYWNQNSYGDAIKITRKQLIAIAIIILIVLPLMNWAIIFLSKLIKKDLIWRY